MAGRSLYIGLDERTTAQIERWATERLVCARCGTEYLELYNIGSWACWQPLDVPGTEGVRIRADHAPRPVIRDERFDVAVGAAAVPYVHFHAHSVLGPEHVGLGADGSPVDTTTTVYVRRYDWHAAGAALLAAQLVAHCARSATYGAGRPATAGVQRASTLGNPLARR